MSKFRVGQRVRIIYAESDYGRPFVGKVGIIKEIKRPAYWGWDAYGLDIAPIVVKGIEAFAWSDEQLAPATDSYDVVSWDACVWKPEHLRMGCMSAQTFVIPPTGREGMVNRLSAFLLAALPGKPLRVEACEYRRRRSDDQNRYLWGCVYPAIINGGGEQLRGWSTDDVHEYLLGEIYGWETLSGFGKKRLRPVKRSSKMTTTEFAEYVSQVQQRMAALGIYVPDPGEAGYEANP